MNLIVDSGNTRVKIFKGDGHQLQEPRIFSVDEEKAIADYIAAVQYTNAILCNVAEPELSWRNLLQSRSHLFIDFDQAVPLPLKNLYQTRETLGYDRLATATGAEVLFPGQPVLVIDAGSAITYDFIDKAAFCGGAISPGMQFRFDVLHQRARRLPLVAYREDFNCPGKSTEESILCGVVEGIKNEIQGTIESYRKKYSNLKTVLTGGDADIFVKKIKNGIFAEPYLLAKGLNRILNYNVEKN